MSALRLPLICLLCGLLLGWVVKGWEARAEAFRLRAEHAQQLERIAAAQAEAIAEQAQIRDQLMRRLAAIDEQRHQELRNAQITTDTLAADLAAARQRLRVRVDPASCTGLPATAPAAGVDDGPGARADLHPSDAAALVRVTGRADECRARLTALQDWARTLSAPQAQD